MELPALLRQAIEAALDGVALADLRRASDLLSQRYRAEIRDGRSHLPDDLAARAYLAVRMPATYAAIRACLDAIAQMRPDFAPRSLLDAGAGPGTALFAIRDRWPSVESATLLESSDAIRRWGERLIVQAGLEQVQWLKQDLASALPGDGGHDLVTLAYVLDELPQAARPPLIARLWRAARDVLLIVEPGTPAGWLRILEARDALIAQGAHIVAPCPHALACPLTPPDWCHFARRVARSRMHRQIKSADVPWEDEKFIYIAAARQPARSAASRIVAPMQARGGTVSLKLCREDGTAAQTLLSRRDGARFREARRAAWGDAIIPSDSGA